MVRLWLIILRERATFFARLWASRDSSKEAMESNLLLQSKNVSGE